MSNLDNIKHIVVLMMENRSFDNVLGWLYPGNSDFRGVNGSMSNPDSKGNLHHVTKGTDFKAPFPDPNEPYQYVYRQMYGKSPKMPIPNTAETPTMQGFVIDYEDAIATANAEANKKRQPAFDTDPGVIMNCFAPESLPVINGLAENFAVCDNWFSSVPTQTFPNRSFVHAATSHGHVYNMWKTGIFFWDIGIFINHTTTIYNLLEKEKIGWKIYHGGPLLLCNTLITQEKLWKYAFTGNRFFPYEQFAKDVQTGALPAYTFIEPNMICSSEYGAENDMHPAYAIIKHGAPTDVRYGDQLIYDIYKALRDSDYWENTLLIIIFDEHGGCFDHVPTPPPPTVSPDGKVIKYKHHGRNGGSNFIFNRFGVRVPAVLVSPWIEKNTICHTQFDHTSVIKTVSNKWLGGRHLTARDAAAVDVSDVLSSTLRTDKPDFKPLPTPPFTGCGDEPLSPLQRDMVAAGHHLVARKTNRLIDLNALDTKEKAAAKMDEISKELIAR